MWRPTSKQAGLAVSLVIDRVTASRLGIAPTTIDNTLYDAYGQRQISTMYTQLNQYHVILETAPQIPTKIRTISRTCTSRRMRHRAQRGAGASSFASSGSTSAGSNATTTSVAIRRRREC
jgi:multidrug efflux pump